MQIVARKLFRLFFSVKEPEVLGDEKNHRSVSRVKDHLVGIWTAGCRKPVDVSVKVFVSSCLPRYFCSVCGLVENYKLLISGKPRDEPLRTWYDVRCTGDITRWVLRARCLMKANDCC